MDWDFLQQPKEDQTGALFDLFGGLTFEVCREGLDNGTTFLRFAVLRPNRGSRLRTPPFCLGVPVKSRLVANWVAMAPEATPRSL